MHVKSIFFIALKKCPLPRGRGGSISRKNTFCFNQSATEGLRQTKPEHHSSWLCCRPLLKERVWVRWGNKKWSVMIQPIDELRMIVLQHSPQNDIAFNPRRTMCAL
ncbi:hypothetical protein C943_01294 [Mariniradius saccharolyticus AK6]|uniref:Uncharacterized protein n=1 Tax=Mariniradius saccharolyticus AK6 TaxID=1239962 RepID=M7XVP6_9BACT|nr:hypothetical protein C943_01294 [Mariniradius saccharolyticus AK6]